EGASGAVGAGEEGAAGQALEGRRRSRSDSSSRHQCRRTLYRGAIGSQGGSAGSGARSQLPPRRAAGAPEPFRGTYRRTFLGGRGRALAGSEGDEGGARGGSEGVGGFEESFTRGGGWKREGAGGNGPRQGGEEGLA
ncbi:unnamed protein product, partial [Laminaria digitata]